VTNGSAGPISGPSGGTVYTFDVTPTNDGDVSVTVVAGAAIDAAGNPSTVSNTLTRTVDRASPTASITTSQTSPTDLVLIPFTVTFNEGVTGFEASDITVTNGTVTNFAGPSGGTTYTFAVSPTGDGQVSVSLNAGGAQELAGGPNTAAGPTTIVSERFAPSATVSSSAAPATKDSPIPFTVTFSEGVTGFDAADITVSGGALGTISGASGGTTYTFNVTPSAEGNVSVTVVAGAAQDASGKPSTVSNPLNVTFDTTAPAAPTIQGLSAASDTGVSGDGTTSNTTPTIQGVGGEPGATITVLVDGNVAG